RRPSTSPSRSCLLSSFCPAAPPTAIYTLSLHDALPIWACERIAALPDDRRVFCFVNVSALHQPNCHYLPGRERDDVDTQLAALRSEEHTSELQSRENLVCRLLLEKKKKQQLLT